MFNPEKVKPDEVSRYEDLAAPGLKGRLCLRNRRSVYNQSLVAFMLDTRGENETTEWIQGMVANLAQPVFSSDTPMIRAVTQGDCGVLWPAAITSAACRLVTRAMPTWPFPARFRCVGPTPST